MHAVYGEVLRLQSWALEERRNLDVASSAFLDHLGMAPHRGPVPRRRREDTVVQGAWTQCCITEPAEPLLRGVVAEPVRGREAHFARLVYFVDEGMGAFPTESSNFT